MGSELRGAELTAQQRKALLKSIQELHSVRPGDVAGSQLADAWFHWFDFGPYLDELHGILAEAGPWLIDNEGQGRELCSRLKRFSGDLCARCRKQRRRSPSRARATAFLPR